MTDPSDQGHQGMDLGVARRHLEAEEEGRWFHVRGPDRKRMHYVPRDVEEGTDPEPRPVRCRVVGSYSETYRRAQERALTESAREDEETARENAPARSNQIFAECVKDWEGFFDGAQAVPCKTENVVRFMEAAPWFREQVVSEVQDHPAFFGNGSGA